MEDAIAYYEANGLDATVAYYRSPESVKGERSLTVLRASDGTILVSTLFPRFEGSNLFTGPGTPMGAFLEQATPEGYFFESFYLNPDTNQQVPALYLAVLHDDLIFLSAHSIAREDAAAATQDYVQKAIDYYDREGLEKTIAYYDSRESVDGHFYLFLIDEDDIYLAHPIFPSLKGTDIKDVVGSDGQELGKEIAEATEEGHWVDYLWPNPVSGLEEPKSAWVIRHDGLIFASGYYTPDPDAEPPAWLDADPHEYTVTYVEQAIARYERDGLNAMINYYNSVISFEGQWYMFIMDANDIYLVHPLLSDLIGTDIKEVVGSDGYELGKEIAKATEEGHWVEYPWPHPFTLQETPKVTYAQRHDGLIFASGYYALPDDPRTYTQDYVDDAIAHYDREGFDATVAYYNSPESVQYGLWRLTLYDGNGTVLTEAVSPHRVGTRGQKVLDLGVTEEGQWVEGNVFNPFAPELNRLHRWFVLHDGLIFQSSYSASE